MNKITESQFKAQWATLYTWKDRKDAGQEGVIERMELTSNGKEITDAEWTAVDNWQRRILGIEPQKKEKTITDEKVVRLRKLLEDMGIAYESKMISYKKEGLAFDLSNIKLNYDQVNKLAGKLNTLSLGSLNLKSCGLEAHLLLPLVEPLKYNKSIKKLNLSFNDLGPSGAPFLAQIFKVNEMIRNLDLGGCYLGDKGFAVLCGKSAFDKAEGVGINKMEGLAANNTITELVLMANDLGDKSAKLIAEIYSESKVITVLNMSHNNFTDVGGVMIADMLIEHPSLRWIMLSSNKLGDRSAIRFAKTIRSTKVMYVLWLDFNNFSKKGVSALRDSVIWKRQKKNHKLKEITHGKMETLY